ncbi:hypothetical protein CDAR_591461 [Caerostris darwini]|uniref:Uncharacterized protein n=1 Tax=Caerostris darwini TaxID=1538125 RepID=A0AAV4PNC4_9ARAC|nr:hypothetical protein CDAR_591461 [Caerostris darwini]
MHGDKLARIRISFIFRKCNKPVLNLINPAEDSFQEEFFDPISPYSIRQRTRGGSVCPFIRFPHPIPDSYDRVSLSLLVQYRRGQQSRVVDSPALPLCVP